MISRWCALAVVLPVLASVAAPAPAVAQESGPPPGATSTLHGVYTASQAEKGAQTYRKNCTNCHAPAAYTGLVFKRVWTGRSAYDLFELIRTTMPNDKPGKLSRGQYAEILAYLLKLNGLPSGEKQLPSDDDALKQITIEVQPAPAPAPAPTGS